MESFVKKTDSVGKLMIDTRGERELLMTREFDAPRELVWKCHTEPKLVQRWLLGPPGWTMPVCEIDLRVGGAYRYLWRNADGREMGMGGVHKEIVAPERLVTSEKFDDDWTGGETLNTLTLTQHGAGTIYTLAVLYATAAGRAAALKSGMADGMEAGYARLDDVLASL